MNGSWIVARLILFAGILAFSNFGCKEAPPTNSSPETSVAVDTQAPDVFTPFFPPEACVGLTPEGSAWVGNPHASASDDLGELDGQGEAISDTPESSPAPMSASFSGDSIGAEESGACPIGSATCLGADRPDWQLFDFQPRSCGFEATYGPEIFDGHVTVVALLASW